jgi:hypothetical protein
MPNVSDFRAIVQGVEQAEKRGDHVAAERLLRQALALQEASVGPNHPEVANILNNLAIVCEINGKLTDAEASYRRAYAIATSRYPANDPFVTTSRENLEQFCTARGIPFKQTPPPGSAASGATAMPASAPAPTPPPPAASSAPPRPAPPLPKTAAPAPKIAAPAPKAAVPPPSRAAAPPSLDDFPLRTSPAAPATLRTLGAPAATREPSRTPMIAAVIAVLVILLASAWYLFSSNTERTASTSSPSPSSSAAPPPASPSPPAPAEPVREPEPAPAETASAPAPAATEPVAPPPTPAPTTPPSVAPEPPAATARTSGVDVVSAELCRSLTTSGAWKCAPPTGTVAPGPMVFYTRVASGRDTTIEHRWYRDDRLHQSVPLRIRANPSGFRTYSRTTITPDRTGTWKVELRTQGGEVLDEKTFVVRP